MSVPLDPENERWAVLLNDSHFIERQRVGLWREHSGKQIRLSRD